MLERARRRVGFAALVLLLAAPAASATPIPEAGSPRASVPTDAVLGAPAGGEDGPIRGGAGFLTGTVRVTSPAGGVPWTSPCIPTVFEFEPLAAALSLADGERLFSGPVTVEDLSGKAAEECVPEAAGSINTPSAPFRMEGSGQGGDLTATGYGTFERIGVHMRMDLTLRFRICPQEDPCGPWVTLPAQVLGSVALPAELDPSSLNARGGILAAEIRAAEPLPPAAP